VAIRDCYQIFRILTRVQFHTALKIIKNPNIWSSHIFCNPYKTISSYENESAGINRLNKNLIVKAQVGVNNNIIVDLNISYLTFPQTGLIVGVE
jgi:hypothetical protein